MSMKIANAENQGSSINDERLHHHHYTQFRSDKHQILLSHLLPLTVHVLIRRYGCNGRYFVRFTPNVPSQEGSCLRIPSAVRLQVDGHVGESPDRYSHLRSIFDEGDRFEPDSQQARLG